MGEIKMTSTPIKPYKRKYCWDCGSKLDIITKLSNYYNSETGVRNSEEDVKCPNEFDGVLLFILIKFYLYIMGKPNKYHL